MNWITLNRITLTWKKWNITWMAFCFKIAPHLLPRLFTYASCHPIVQSQVCQHSMVALVSSSSELLACNPSRYPSWPESSVNMSRNNWILLSLSPSPIWVSYLRSIAHLNFHLTPSHLPASALESRAVWWGSVALVCRPPVRMDALCQSGSILICGPPLASLPLRSPAPQSADTGVCSDTLVSTLPAFLRVFRQAFHHSHDSSFGPRKRQIGIHLFSC